MGTSHPPAPSPNTTDSLEPVRSRVYTPPSHSPSHYHTHPPQSWVSHFRSSSTSYGERRRCAFSWSVLTLPERPRFSTSSSSVKSSPPSPPSVSTSRLSSTRTSSSPCGMSVVRTRSVLCGGITSRTPRVSSSSLTATIATVLLRRVRSCSAC